MDDTEVVDRIIRDHGYTDYHWCDPSSIIVAEWVRLKCEFGCPSYGHIASCPPNTPSVEECRAFFREYSRAVVFHLVKVAPDQKMRRAWSAQTNVALGKVERQVFLTGYRKAFLLFMDSCHICAECVPERSGCKEPKLSRPSPEGMAVDVFATVRQLGYPIDVLTDPSDLMNRYAFLLVD